MKFKLGLIVAFLLTLSGLYAVTAWSITDMRHTGYHLEQMESRYTASFPFFMGTMKATILFLLGLCAAAVVVILNIGRGNTALQRGLRVAVLLLAMVTGSMLVFALM